MGRCSSSTYKIRQRVPEKSQAAVTYQQSTGDQDKNAAVLAGRLGIQGGDLVSDLLEGKVLQRMLSVRGTEQIRRVADAYHQLVHDATGSLDGLRLKGEHGLVALHVSVSRCLCIASCVSGC